MFDQYCERDTRTFTYSVLYLARADISANNREQEILLSHYNMYSNNRVE